MNEIGMQIIWAALQVTLLTLVGAVLYVITVRRWPHTGSAIAAACLAAAITLSLAAACPLPRWWSWANVGARSSARSDLASTTNLETAASVSGRETGPADAGQFTRGFEFSPSLLGHAFQSLSVKTHPADERAWPWLAGLTLAFAAGLAFCLARFGIGLWAVQRLRWRSPRIDDPEVIRLAATLRAEMRCGRNVAIYESAELSTAATIGWRRPLILLPADWRNWSEAELRAVLAHELAHICRADYPIWLIARLSAALHFYHPIVHWLVGRLHLQQEMAADALGAQFAGGPAAYLRAFSNLALRQDDRPLWGPARAFLPAHRGTLMRRIAMLREGSLSRRSRWANAHSTIGRTLVLGCLCLMGLGLSALRGPAQNPAEKSGDDSKIVVAAAKTVTTTSRPPFVFTRYAPESAGVFAIRPAEIFRYQGTKELAKQWNDQLREFLKEFGIADAIPPIEKIEQITGAIQFSYNPKAPEGSRHSVMASLPLVRTTPDYDWNTLFNAIDKSEKVQKELFKKIEEITYQGKTYYKLSDSPILGAVKDHTVCVYLLDKHTLVLDDEDAIKQIIAKGLPSAPEWIHEAGWERIANGLVAIAFDNRKNALGSTVENDTPKQFAGLKKLFKKMTYCLQGADATEQETSMYAFGSFADDKSAGDAANAVTALVALGSLTLGIEMKKADRVDPMINFGQQFMTNAKVECQADASGKKTILHVQTQANVDVKKVVDYLKEEEPKKK